MYRNCLRPALAARQAWAPRQAAAAPLAARFMATSPSPRSANSSSSTARSAPASSETMDSMPSLASQTVSPLVASEQGSYHLESADAYLGMASQPFPDDVVEVLLAAIEADDVEIKPDGLLYLPEIKYRRILNRAFKPGGWALVPRGPHSLTGRVISREYALFAFGRFVSQARGEQEVFDEKQLATAMEGCKSNALMRCCKDLGIASELWDPSFIRKFKAEHCEHIWVKHVVRNTKLKLWRRKGQSVDYPYELLK
ncbi:mitochondrial genome maintenance MGM101-domain-containing protein [Catenaria anguillulae PL171]|uniref:Mitochondrial genome maintenance protein MGM101 n=1 Tax=Catenaria anguillulae PL171 TaxID=765915 RepID=A0A1Y2I156_9FUNG|nr:mitochondrial genome maintenance MGM101-domain-containing protein [Catenaria anguillulae PL171]